MPDHACTRRIQLLELLRQSDGGIALDDAAVALGADGRTVRRDVDYWQDLFSDLQGITIQRGRLHASRRGYTAGYFTDQVDHERSAKDAIGRAAVAAIADGEAVAITAGSTTYAVARELRRARIEEDRPRNATVFTNSLPVLWELVAAGLPTGVLGEVYDADDCAFHSHEFRSGFQASLAIVGASGLVVGADGASLDLFSHRSAEAAFMKQLLAPIPEVIVAIDASKIGRRHPWSFTSGGVLAGKRVQVITSSLADKQRDPLEGLCGAAPRSGFTLSFQEV